MWRDEATLLDLVKAARKALGFVAGIDRDGFVADEKTQSAVLHQLLVMGEATKRLSESFRDQVPDIPWRRIAGMRDRLIHGYNEIDFEQVWETIIVDLPTMLRILEPLAQSDDSTKE